MKSNAKTSTAHKAERQTPLSVVHLPLADILPSPLNRDIKKEDVTELATSIKAFGVQQPIRVRPLHGKHEIVFGERRWLAAKQAGLTEIPCVVQQLTDDEAQTLRILENTQRSDPHPLDEAEAFEKLLAMVDAKGAPIHTVASIVAISGRAEPTVYNRLKLTTLSKDWRKAYRAGHIAYSGAVFLARSIPATLQAEAYAKLFDPETEEPSKTSGYNAINPDTGAYRDAWLYQHVEQTYLAQLAKAPFSTKNATLVPNAGACSTCQKRTDKQPTLFQADEKLGSRCLDLACFRDKAGAHIRTLEAEAKRNNQRVATPEEIAKLFRYGSTDLPRNSPVVDVDAPLDPDYNAPPKTTWRSLIGADAPEIVLAVVAGGKALYLANRARLEEVASEKKLLPKWKAKARDKHDPGNGVSAKGTDAISKAQREQNARDRHIGRIETVTRDTILEKTITAFEALDASNPALFQLVLYALMARIGSETTKAIARRRKPDLMEKKDSFPHEIVATLAKALSEPQVRGLIAEMALETNADLHDHKDYMKRTRAFDHFPALVGVDAKAVRAEVAARLDAERAEKVAKKKPS